MANEKSLPQDLPVVLDSVSVFVVLAILVTLALRPARHGIESQGLQILAEAVNAYQSGGEPSAHEYLEDIFHKQHVRAFIFDAAGHELAGRACRPGSRTFVRA